MSNLFLDLICSLLILFINILTLFFMLENLKRKKHLTHQNNNENSQQHVDKGVKKAQKAQTRTTQMVLASSSINFLGHSIHFIHIISIYFFDLTSKIYKCFWAFSSTFLIITYSCSFFIYLFFNLNFRKFYIQLIFKALKWISFDRIDFLTVKPNQSTNLMTMSTTRRTAH